MYNDLYMGPVKLRSISSANYRPKRLYVLLIKEGEDSFRLSLLKLRYGLPVSERHKLARNTSVVHELGSYDWWSGSYCSHGHEPSESSRSTVLYGILGRDVLLLCIAWCLCWQLEGFFLNATVFYLNTIFLVPDMNQFDGVDVCGIKYSP